MYYKKILLWQYINIFIKDYTDLNDDIHEQPCLTKPNQRRERQEEKGKGEKMLNTTLIIDGARVAMFF